MIPVQAAAEEKLVRSDVYTYTSHPRVKGAHVRPEEAKDFINRVLSSYALFRGADMNKLETIFNFNNHPRFELVTDAKIGRSIAFQNGYFDVDTMMFHEDKEPPLATKHFFDRAVDMAAINVPTPLWDSLLAA